jgi:hypothetical protein
MAMPPQVPAQTFLPQTSFAPPAGLKIGDFNVNQGLSDVAGLANTVAANFAPDPRVRASRQEGIQQQSAQQQQLLQSQIQASVERFKGISQMVQSIAQQTGGQIPPAIQQIVDTETQMLGGFLQQAGQDPAQAEQLRQITLGQANIPASPGEGFSLSPGQVRFDANGNPIAGVEAGQGPYAQKIAEVEAALGRSTTEQEKLQIANAVANPQGFSLTIDPSTGQVALTQGGGGVGGGAGGTGGGTGGPGTIPVGTPPAALVQETGERLRYMDQAVTDIDTLIGIGQQPGAQFGGVGTLKREVREWARLAKEGTAGELGAILSGPLKNLAQTAENLIGAEVREGLIEPAAAAELLSGDPLTSAADLEKRLAYFYARTLQPADKMLADTIETAKQQTKIFTWFSSEQTAIEKLISLRQGLVAARNNLAASAPGFQGQAPVEGGSSGAAPALGAPAAAAAPAGQVPEGLPPGSTDTGQRSVNGLPVWKAPNGDLYEVE